MYKAVSRGPVPLTILPASRVVAFTYCNADLCHERSASWERARAFRDKMTTTSFDIPRELLEKKDKRFFLWCSLKDTCDDKKVRLFGQLLL
jgi:hypothetical protein